MLWIDCDCICHDGQGTAGTVGMMVKREIGSIAFSIFGLPRGFLSGPTFWVPHGRALQLVSLRSRSPPFWVLSIITLLERPVYPSSGEYTLMCVVVSFEYPRNTPTRPVSCNVSWRHPFTIIFGLM
jgi:hypothetical protein